MDGVHITAVTAKMHLWFVQVSNSASNKFHSLTFCSLKAAGIVGGSSVEPLFCSYCSLLFILSREPRVQEVDEDLRGEVAVPRVNCQSGFIL